MCLTSVPIKRAKSAFNFFLWSLFLAPADTFCLLAAFFPSNSCSRTAGDAFLQQLMGPIFRLKFVLFMAWLQKVQEPQLFLIGTKSPLLDFTKRGVEPSPCSPIGQRAESLGVQHRRVHLTGSFPSSGVQTVCRAR